MTITPSKVLDESVNEQADMKINTEFQYVGIKDSKDDLIKKESYNVENNNLLNEQSRR